MAKTEFRFLHICHFKPTLFSSESTPILICRFRIQFMPHYLSDSGSNIVSIVSFRMVSKLMQNKTTIQKRVFDTFLGRKCYTSQAMTDRQK